ncbi:hypothetical protein [Mesorhizobium sp. M0228]|uniref:hypothetical protein n=1 Tax=Mesorhizobium sp. M0228 TaxID=2956923 RepID=UPI00333BBD65
MPSLASWIQNWREVAEEVPAGDYAPINVERDGVSYEILRISNFDPQIDGERRCVRTGAREFDDRVALFTHLTRDIGLVRVISLRGRPRWVLEPGADSLEWVADVEGVSVRELTLAAREGALGRHVARLLRRRERRSREVLDLRSRHCESGRRMSRPRQRFNVPSYRPGSVICRVTTEINLGDLAPLI